MLLLTIALDVRIPAAIELLQNRPTIAVLYPFARCILSFLVQSLLSFEIVISCFVHTYIYPYIWSFPCFALLDAKLLYSFRTNDLILCSRRPLIFKYSRLLRQLTSRPNSLHLTQEPSNLVLFVKSNVKPSAQGYLFSPASQKYANTGPILVTCNPWRIHSKRPTVRLNDLVNYTHGRDGDRGRWTR